MKRPAQPRIRLSEPPAKLPTGGSGGSRPDRAREVAALREATREAHEVLRDLRQERRAVEQLLEGIEGRVRRAVADRMEEAVTRQVADLGEVTEKAMRASVAKVGREFERLERIFTGREKGARPLEDLIRRHVATHPEVTP